MSSGETTNPWLKVPAADYEGHMRSPAVGQLKFLSAVFGDLLREYRPKTIAVAGCATGNGFERIDPAEVERVIGIDINREYLELARERFGATLPLELICKNVLDCDLEPHSLDLIFAGLIFEYLDPDSALQRFANWLRPMGVLAVVLQLPCARGKVTATEFKSVNCLDGIMQLVEPDRLTELAEKRNLKLLTSRVETLPSGKSFFIGAYRLA